MTDTPERAAWLAGYEAATAFVAALDTGSQPSDATRAESGLSYPAIMFGAWLNGYGHGISEAAGPVIGHHLSYVFNHETRTGRTELIRER